MLRSRIGWMQFETVTSFGLVCFSLCLLATSLFPAILNGHKLDGPLRSAPFSTLDIGIALATGGFGALLGYLLWPAVLAAQTAFVANVLRLGGIASLLCRDYQERWLVWRSDGPSLKRSSSYGKGAKKEILALSYEARCRERGIAPYLWHSWLRWSDAAAVVLILIAIVAGLLAYQVEAAQSTALLLACACVFLLAFAHILGLRFLLVDTCNAAVREALAQSIESGSALGRESTDSPEGVGEWS